MMKKVLFPLLLCFSSLFSEVLVFCHIPKCGRTTVTSLIGQKFHTKEIYKFRYGRNDNHLFLNPMGKIDFLGFKYMGGHLPFCELSKVPEAKLFTFLRDPVYRVFSHYRFCLENMENLPSFEEYYQKVTNFQVRYLSSLPKEAPLLSIYKALKRTWNNAFSLLELQRRCQKLLKPFLSFADGSLRKRRRFLIPRQMMGDSSLSLFDLSINRSGPIANSMLMVVVPEKVLSA